MRSVDTQAMTNQPPQPSSQYVIAAYQEEVTTLNANRMYLLASMKEMKHEAETEIQRLHGVIASIVSMVSDEDDRAQITTYLEGSSDGATGD